MRKENNMEIIQEIATALGYCCLYLLVCAVGSCAINHTTDVGSDDFFIGVIVIQFVVACLYIGYKVIY